MCLMSATARDTENPGATKEACSRHRHWRAQACMHMACTGRMTPRRTAHRAAEHSPAVGGGCWAAYLRLLFSVPHRAWSRPPGASRRAGLRFLAFGNVAVDVHVRGRALNVGSAIFTGSGAGGFADERPTLRLNQEVWAGPTWEGRDKGRQCCMRGSARTFWLTAGGLADMKTMRDGGWYATPLPRDAA